MRKRSIALVLVLAMIATLMIGILPASASSTYNISNVRTLAPTIKGHMTFIGDITINLDAGSMTDSNASNKFVILDLPQDYKWATGWDADADGTITEAEMALAGAAADWKDAYANHPIISVPVNPPAAQPQDYAFARLAADAGPCADLNVEVLSARSVKITIANVTNELKPGVILLQNLGIYVPNGASNGAITMSANAQSISVFSNGTLDIAKIGTTSVLVGSTDNKSIGGSGGYATLTVKEASGGSMEATNSSLKWKLPQGFKWHIVKSATGLGSENDFTPYWGSSVADTELPAGIEYNDFAELLSTEDGGRTLILDNNPRMFTGSYFKFKIAIDADDTKAKTGDIKVSMGGDSDTNPTSFVVGTYGDFGATITADNPPTIYAGKYGQTVATISIKEAIAASLIPGRSVTLKLPPGAKWDTVPDFTSSDSDYDGLATPAFVSNSTDAQSVRWAISGDETTDAATIVFKDGEVVTAADFSGDLKVTISGSAGFTTKDLVIAKVVPSVVGTVTATKDLKIGVASQAVGDVTITEAASEIFDSQGHDYRIPTNDADADYAADQGYVVVEKNEFAGQIELWAPPGVTFDGMPDVVVEGDVDVDAYTSGATMAADNSYVAVPVSGTSVAASKITFKNIKLNVDRTVVEGSLKLSVRGDAVIDDNLNGSDSVLFSPQRNAAQVVVGKVVTPAPTEMNNSASFTIGSTTYKVNGVDQTMDVAPYIKDGRTFMPLRYVALAIGVAEQNIIWDASAQTVTLMKGDKVVQVKIGSTTMLVNGVAITMDVAPEIKDGRTMLPLRFLGNAFGVTTNWDAATNTATIK